RAATAIERSRRGFSPAGSPLVWYAELSLAVIDYQNHAYSRALARVVEVQRHCPAARYPGVVARALWIRGVIHGVRAQLEAAFGDYSAALAIYQRLGEQEHVAAVHRLLAEYFLVVVDHAETWRHLDAALGGVASVADPERQEAIFAVAALAAAEEDE